MATGSGRGRRLRAMPAWLFIARPRITTVLTTTGSFVKYSGNVLPLSHLFSPRHLSRERERAPLLFRGRELVELGRPTTARSLAPPGSRIIGRPSDNLTGDNRDTIVTGRQAGAFRRETTRERLECTRGEN